MRLENFVGNQRIVGLLRRGRLPQASLFTGPEGIGKKTLALSLAALTNCKDGSGTDLCEKCSSCVKASIGNHPDISLFQPQKHFIRIDAMRELNREVQFRPFEGRLRLFIIDQAETMTHEAANSILKTLEEPPETSRIVLVSAFPHRLLPTIRSRCQDFCFHPLDRKEIRTYLENHLPGEDAELRAAFADGSIGTALELNLEETLRDRDRMLELLTSWCRRQSFEILYRKCEEQPLRSDLKKRERVRHYLDLLQLLGEDLYFLQVNTPERVVNRDQITDLKKLSEGISLSWIKDLLYDIDRSRWEIDHYVNPLMCFETLWLMNPGEASNAGNRHRQV
ncbi:DNA polymerase III subunit delta' [Acidobacteria bacterium AH-259-O06]|nr:DNA polymerase III subunit delta' [Acidobacteria bacterium AH-259-O06]